MSSIGLIACGGAEVQASLFQDAISPHGRHGKHPTSHARVLVNPFAMHTHAHTTNTEHTDGRKNLLHLPLASRSLARSYRKKSSNTALTLAAGCCRIISRLIISTAHMAHPLRDY
jgi:hypothetical protein